MGPSNRKHHSKSKKSTCAPSCISTGLPTATTTNISPPDDTSESSATHVVFQEFIELADLSSIKVFITTASSSPEGENLKLLWGRAFKEGLIAGHKLYGKTEERLKEVHEEGFQAGYNEGRNDERGDWALDGHGIHCGYQSDQSAIPYDDHGTLTDPTATSESSIITETRVTVATQTDPLISSTFSTALATQTESPAMALTTDATSQTEPSTFVENGTIISMDSTNGPVY
jgi:hypothetical protein